MNIVSGQSPTCPNLIPAIKNTGQAFVRFSVCFFLFYISILFLFYIYYLIEYIDASTLPCSLHSFIVSLSHRRFQYLSTYHAPKEKKKENKKQNKTNSKQQIASVEDKMGPSVLWLAIAFPLAQCILYSICCV